MIVATALVALLAGPAGPTSDWIGEDGGLLALKLAHQEDGRTDGGLLRVDTARRLVLWEGIPGELGCRERIEANFEDVRSVRVGRDAGFVLELRDGRRFVFLPLPHAAWFAKQLEVRNDSLRTAVAGGGIAGSGGGRAGGDEMAVGGSAASASSLRRLQLPDGVTADIRRAVDAVREALGRPQAPGAVLREALHGAPIDVSLAELLEAPTAYAGRAVRVRGRLAAGRSPAGEHQLTEDGATVAVSAAAEIATMVASQVASWNGEDVEVTGLFRRDPLADRAPYSILFWEYTAPEHVAARDRAARSTTLAALAAGEALSSERVRVVGRFRGRNIFGDLPDGNGVKDDWVIKDGPHAAWIRGKGPRGRGWALNLDTAEDTRNWVEVVGRPELRKGVLRLRAESVALVPPPAGAAHVQPGHRVNVTRSIRPVVVFFLPVEGDPMNPDGRLILQFNKYMDEDTFRGHVRLRYADGGAELAGVKLTYDDARRALIIDPGDRLEAGRRIECVLMAGIADADGVPLTRRSGRPADEGAVDVLSFEVGL